MVTRFYLTRATLIALNCFILLFLSNSCGALPPSMPYYLPKSLRNLVHDFSSKPPVDKVLEKSATSVGCETSKLHRDRNNSQTPPTVILEEKRNAQTKALQAISKSDAQASN
ncbi:hypothetical protein DdX_17142 [Ditylenchus destructor]|uniref:Uncharacterized protein n=1 Tax=Ditylenchus destructor TaxID=166010 RepID=A0AAD4MNQ4_9BILA|nr:hypothetical protein DdX_17142 [Ditylenchus destructor]